MKFDVYFRGGRWWVVYLVGVNIRYRSKFNPKKAYLKFVRNIPDQMADLSDALKFPTCF